MGLGIEPDDMQPAGGSSLGTAQSRLLSILHTAPASVLPGRMCRPQLSCESERDNSRDHGWLRTLHGQEHGPE